MADAQSFLIKKHMCWPADSLMQWQWQELHGAAQQHAAAADGVGLLKGTSVKIGMPDAGSAG